MQQFLFLRTSMKSLACVSFLNGSAWGYVCDSQDLPLYLIYWQYWRTVKQSLKNKEAFAPIFCNLHIIQLLTLLFGMWKIVIFSHSCFPEQKHFHNANLRDLVLFSRKFIRKTDLSSACLSKPINHPCWKILHLRFCIKEIYLSGK